MTQLNWTALAKNNVTGEIFFRLAGAKKTDNNTFLLYNNGPTTKAQLVTLFELCDIDARTLPDMIKIAGDSINIYSTDTLKLIADARIFYILAEAFRDYDWKRNATTPVSMEAIHHHCTSYSRPYIMESEIKRALGKQGINFTESNKIEDRASLDA